MVLGWKVGWKVGEFSGDPEVAWSRRMRGRQGSP